MGGTSNWQNIALCVEALMKIQPQRVLDVGMGFGRWGMLIREFCEVWYGRVHRSQWTIHIEGVEAHQPNIDEYHDVFYNQIHVGDLQQIRPELQGPWDAIIFGDVLEHFTKETGLDLLQWAYSQGSYLLVNLPLGEDWEQDGLYGNPYERHLSSWRTSDFKDYQVVRQEHFLDFRERPFASMILSATDPAGLARHEPDMFTFADLDRWFAGRPHMVLAELVAKEQDILKRVHRDKEELINIRLSYSHRLIRMLKRLPGMRAAERVAEALVFKPLGRLTGAVRTRKLAKQQPYDHVWLENLGPPLAGDSGSSPRGRLRVLAVERDGYCFLEQSQIQWEGDWRWESDQASPSGQSMINQAPGTASLKVEPGDLVIFLAHPAGGRVKVTRRGRVSELDLNSPQPELVVYDTAGHEVTRRPTPQSAVSGQAPPQAPAVTQFTTSFTPAESIWIQQMVENPHPLSVANPAWRGIYSSTEELFDNIYDLPDTLTKPTAMHHAMVLKEAGLDRVVLQGFAFTYHHLVKSLNRVAPEMKVYAMWHGNFLQSLENYAWTCFKSMTELWREGAIHKLGFVKQGMAEVMAVEGRPTGFVMNLVRRIPQGPSVPLEGGPHLGNWNLNSNWRKPVYAMLISSRLIPGAVMHNTGAILREMDFISHMNLNCQASSEYLSQSNLLERMSLMHLNLYVTLSECAPMLPLESLSVGAPCLLGPNSHYFLDHPALHKYLVVPYPDSAAVIAEKARAAIENRDEIVRLYMEYAPEYNQRAKESLRRFLSD